MCVCVGEHDSGGAEVRGCQGAPLEAADAASARQLGAVGAHPRTPLGHRSDPQRGRHQGRAGGRSRGDGARGVPQTGQQLVLTSSYYRR